MQLHFNSTVLRGRLFMFVFFLINFIPVCHAQIDSVESMSYKEQMPEYPGGQKEMMKFIKSRMKYPQAAYDLGITGKVIVQFVIMDELRALGDVGVLYSSYIKEDGCSFVHFSIHRNSDEPNIIPTLEAFKAFSTQLKAEGLVTPPQTIKLEMVAKSFDL